MKIERNAIQEYLEAIVDSTAFRCVFTVDTLSPELYSVARFYYGRFMSSFMKLPFITRFFLSISFTFALAAMSLKVIFFFYEAHARCSSCGQEGGGSERGNAQKEALLTVGFVGNRKHN